VAVVDQVTAPATTARRVTPWHFVRLKLRIMGNNLRGQGWRIALYVLGALFGLWFAVGGFFALLGAGVAGDGEFALVGAAIGGGLLVFGWLFLPLVFFGVDESLDPARFALLPLPRRTLVAGMFTAALVGVPAVATLLATSGLVVAAAVTGGPVAALVAAVGVLAGLFLCVAASRAMTSGFASMLRSRRVRDLAAVLLAVFAASLGPVQIAVASAAENTDWRGLAGVAEVIGWTPFGSAYTVGVDAATGRWWAVPVKLLVTVATIGVLLWWWSRSLESAMVGTASGGAAKAVRGPTGGPLAQLFPRWPAGLPRNRYGALVAREARYWWRDTRRRANLITLTVVGVFVPVVVNVGVGDLIAGRSSTTSPGRLAASMVLVGVVATVNLANQFGFDGSAYAANVVAAVPGRVELRARAVAFSAYAVPLLMAVSVLVVALVGKVGSWPMVAGTLLATYGLGLAVNVLVSVLGPYALPETTNPFAVNSGAGLVKGLLTFVSMIVSVLLASPLVLADVLLDGPVWRWLSLPVGVAYGLLAALLGTWLAGGLLDRRQPELLVAVTPRR
jgi:ABC-2 type transport system permease protein